MGQLNLSKKEGRYLNKISALAKMDLLILDDFALHPIKPEHRQILMDIMDDRFNIKSTIICSQLPVKAWYEVIEEPTIADAILPARTERYVRAGTVSFITRTESN